jgi:outer membrane protein assembly factor BamB
VQASLFLNERSPSDCEKPCGRGGVCLWSRFFPWRDLVVKNLACFAAAAVVSVGAFLSSLSAADWPGFRGNNGGTAADDDLPVKWTKDNFLWKVKLPGPGTSSPITTGDKLIVTCYTGYGTQITKGMGGFGGGGFGKGGFGKGGFGKGGFGKGGFGKGGANDPAQKNLKLMVLCLDRHKGTVLWQKEVEPKLPEVSFTGFMREHGYASSTPVTDGERVYAFFGKTGVVAFDLEGKQLWQAGVGKGTNMWGSGASPVLHKNLVIVNAAIESEALVALDRMTGKEVWRARGVGTCWSSPVVAETKDGKHEVVVNMPGKVVGYDPQTGEKLWTCTGIGSAGGFGYTASTPVARDGVVYVIGGGGPSVRATALAIKAGGRGDVTKTHLLWKRNSGTSMASPVLVGDHLCWVAGTATSLKAADGKVAYQERLYSDRNEYVSAVAAGGKIFALTRTEGLYVLAGGDKFERLAHNEFAGDSSIFNASPAISGGRLYVRSNAYLYCIGNKPQ